MQPLLSLDYSSRRGNGLVGVGWGLSGMSQISHCRKDQHIDSDARGIKFDDQDRYCLDGSELVVVSGTYGGDGSEYRTDPDSMMKIVSLVATTDACGVGGGPTSFTVFSKDGRILHYGTSCDSIGWATEAKVDDPVTTEPVRRQLTWALSKVEDRSGNYMQYSYNSRGGEFSDSPNVELSLARIDYGLPLVSGTGIKRYVAFTYEGRPWA